MKGSVDLLAGKRRPNVCLSDRSLTIYASIPLFDSSFRPILNDRGLRQIYSKNSRDSFEPEERSIRFSAIFAR